MRPAPILEEIVTLAARRGVPVREVSEARLDGEARTAAPQGVLAHAGPAPLVELDDLLHPAGGVVPFLLVIEAVSDPQNVGALLRTAAAAGATGVVLGRHRGALLTPSAVKAAAGAVELLPLCVVAGIPAALARARERGVWVVGLEPGGEPVWQLAVADQPVALVVGAEGPGLSRLARQRCDVLAGIPMPGQVDSLNVGAAAAVALFAVAWARNGRFEQM
jgi:23S rRNA (guanosine2251-2'-O)-methyltransferase